MINQGYCQLPELSCVQLSGVDARTFLHSQLSVDVVGIGQGESRLAAYCDPKGRVISNLVLAYSDESFYLVLPLVLASQVRDTLLRYRMRAKAEIKLIEDLQLFGCFTVNSEIQLQIPHPLDPQRSFALLSSNTQASSDLEKWKLADIDCRMVWLDQYSSLQQLPQSLGLVDNGAVDFDKGCYPGQEIVARLKYLGKSKSDLYKITANMLSSDSFNAITIRTGTGSKQGQLLNYQISATKLTALAVIKNTAVNDKNELFACSVDEIVLSESLKISS